MLKNVKIRILAFIMAVTLSFCVVSSEYQEVKALEWAGTVVAFDTAMKAILGLLGVGVAVGTASQIDWGQLKDDCVEYQIAQGNNSALVGKWWNDVINGALDTGSECWTSFKSWVQNELLDSGSGGAVPSFVVSSAVKVLLPNASLYGVSSEYTDFTFNFAVCMVSGNRKFFYFYDNAFPSFGNPVTSLSINRLDDSNKVTKLEMYFDGNDLMYQPSISTFSSTSSNIYSDSYILGYPGTLPSNYRTWDVPIEDTSGDLVGSLSDIGAIGLAPDVATDLPYDGVIDIPWENVGATDTAIDDAFDDALDKVNTGTWTLDQYWTWVQNVTNVFAYDTTNNFLLPNDGDDEKADDKIQQNINRGAMVLYGLEKVFPFCIPWDIYAFVNLLVADPVAPVIEYPIYNPVSGEDEVITIDFSVWESQVILMRYIQDFLLIIGLLLLARSLIGAGGSD